MKWNIYQPTTFLSLAMTFLFSCQSKVQEDNTAYERFKQKKLKEKDSTFIQTDPISAGKENMDTSLAMTNQRKAAPATAMAKVPRTTSGTESDAVSDYTQSSAEIPKINKATIVKENATTDENFHKKGVKQKKHIEWPKINKINLKKKKKQKGAEEVG